ncbi:MAG: DUF1887 family protein [Clostridia bacterium]|nr:DUF1887 family protein [Clostridia bacterium]
MTCIEFLDPTAAENVCACITAAPDRVILVGDKAKQLKKHAERYASVFKTVEFGYKSVTKNDMSDIVAVLSELVETYDDCVFDLTGGEDLYLVAVGIVHERYSDRNIQMHRFNIRNGKIIDCDEDGRTLRTSETIRLSIGDNIRIYGGDVAYDTEKSGGTHLWQYDSQFRAEIDAIWDVCKGDVKAWNSHMGILAMAEGNRKADTDELTTLVRLSEQSPSVRNSLKTFAEKREIAGKLQQTGFIDYSISKSEFRITYKNDQVKRCLIKAGQALEMKIFSAAKMLTDKDGSSYYNDVMNGVCIDWDGEIHALSEGPDTENEIDVMLMKGAVPIFISCKNGNVGTDELYKLNTVAEKFGRQYAKKVLIATALEQNSLSADYFRQRAEDMDIRLVEGIQEMDDEKLGNELKKLWNS